MPARLHAHGAGDPPSTSIEGPRGQASGVGDTTLLIGIDDTDSLDSPGTGRLAQRLLAELRAAGLGEPVGATRHQLLVDPRIPYTSHNSCACIAWRWREPGRSASFIDLCARFLKRESAAGSDPGLAVLECASLTSTSAAALAVFGTRAKQEVLSQPQAWEVAHKTGVHLSGHGGTNGGVIGALGAVGLHLSGNDGLFLWMEGIRELKGSATYRQLRELVPIDRAVDPAGIQPAAADTIDLGDWVRPVLRDGAAVLLLERAATTTRPPRWKVSPRDVVKRH